jgi:hypothetical protein
MRCHRSLAGIGLLAVLVGSIGLGCAYGEIRWKDPLGRKKALEESQKRYTDLVRWSAFDKAVRYVDPEVREEFLDIAPSFEQLRFSDYEIVPIEIDQETGEATVEVTYHAYSMASAYEVAIVETQHWSRDDFTNSWRVRPSFEGLEPYAGGGRSDGPDE